MTRRITAAVLCIGVFMGLVATADAARKYRSGTYKGETSQGAKVSLKVLRNKKALVKFYWEGARLTCSNGQEPSLDGFKTPASEKIKLSSKGKFSFRVRNANGSLEFNAQGRIKNKRATGALQVQARSNEQGQLDPNGSVTCDSDIVAWSAKRK